jgi:integrase
MPRRKTGPRIVTRRGKPFYFIRFINNDGKQRELTTGTSDHEQAQEFLADFIRSKGPVGRPKEHRFYQVADVLADYALHIADNKSAAKRTAYAMVHLLKFWDGKCLDQVNAVTIKNYEQSAGRSVSTVRRELSVLQTAIKHAYETLRIERFAKLTIPPESEPRDRWLTRSEVAKLMRFARKEYRTRYTLCLFILIALYSGQRKRAILDLEWSQIDFVNRTLNFKKNGEKETNKRRAFMPIGKKLYGHLARRHAVGEGLCPYVFHQKEDKSRRVLDVSKGFRAVARRADLVDVTPHTLRHTCASWLAQRGEKMIDVAAYLNMSVRTLSKVYAHHNKQHIVDLADRF